MRQFDICKGFDFRGQISDGMAGVMRMFGLSAESLSENRIVHQCQLKIEQGDVVYFSGPSGAGKTVLFRELEKMVPESERVNLQEILLSNDKAVIDCLEGDLLSRLKILSVAGLNDVYCVLKRPAVLSEGQQWRFRLAAAMTLSRPFIFADEFCSNLDFVTAAVVSYNVRKYADKHRVSFVLAGSRTDFLTDLAADVLVKKDFGGSGQVIYKEARK